MASFLLFGRWAEVDPTAAMSFSNTMGFAGMFVRPTILQSWASVDPANAAKYYAENPREFAMMGMMGGGPRPDGRAGRCLDHRQRMGAPGSRRRPGSGRTRLTTEKGQAMSAVVGEVAKTDPAQGGRDARLDERRRSGRCLSLGGRRNMEPPISAKPRHGSARCRPTIRPPRLHPRSADFPTTIPQAAARQLALMEDGDAKNRVDFRRGGGLGANRSHKPPRISSNNKPTREPSATACAN